MLAYQDEPLATSDDGENIEDEEDADEEGLTWNFANFCHVIAAFRKHGPCQYMVSAFLCCVV